MQFQAKLTGCGLPPGHRDRLTKLWDRCIADLIGPVLADVYRRCQGHEALKGFLWGQSEAEWVGNQRSRWQAVFRNGIDAPHVERVREFAEGDLASGMDPAVYGQFFSTMARTLIEHIMKDEATGESRTEAVQQVTALMSAEATLAFTSFNKALSDQAAATIRSLTDAMQESARENVGGVAAASEELSASMSTIRSNISSNLGQVETIEGTLEAADTQVGELTDSIGDIGALLDSITKIANQTNMLALNATIEAARAGDAGRGFAVVAREVKDLASQTRLAADNIGKSTAMVETRLAQLRSSFGEVTEKVAAMLAFLRETDSATGDQLIATEEIAERMSVINAEIESTIRRILDEYGAA